LLRHPKYVIVRSFNVLHTLFNINQINFFIRLSSREL